MNVADFLSPEIWLKPQSGPRYAQLRSHLSSGIENSTLAPGQSLPPERAIANLTGLSRVTVRKAIKSLVERGLIVQRQGSGSFVASHSPQIEMSLSSLTSFGEDMQRRGITTPSKWIERGVVLPSPDAAIALALDPQSSVSRIARLRIAEGKPMAIERTSLPIDILPNPLSVETSLYETLKAQGHPPVRALQKISAFTLSGADAELLETEEGVAGLRIERTSFLATGRAVAFTRSVYPGDTYYFVAELRLAKE